MNYLETLFWKLAKYIIRKGYGDGCETSDLDDFHEIWGKEKLAESVNDSRRCGACRAKEVMDWIDGHIELINML